MVPGRGELFLLRVLARRFHAAAAGKLGRRTICLALWLGRLAGRARRAVRCSGSASPPISACSASSNITISSPLRLIERRAGRSARRQHAVHRGGAAGRDLVPHLPRAVLHHRRLPAQAHADALAGRHPALHQLLPAPRRRPDRARARPSSQQTVRRVATRGHRARR